MALTGIVTPGELVIAWILAAAHAGPDVAADCDVLARHYQKQTRDRPVERPDLWWLQDEPCPLGSALTGAPPPQGDAVWCEDKRQRRQGPRTDFAGGRIVKVSAFLDDVELGPRIEWDAEGRVIRITELERGRVHGVTVEWTPDGGVTHTQFVKGDQVGATWRFDPTGTLVVVEHWSGGARNGRSCTWRDGNVDTDQLWKNGEPLAD